MSENLNNKEKAFKRILEGIPGNVNTDDIWTRLEKDLPSKSEKKRFPIWWMVGILALVLISGIIGYKTANIHKSTTSDQYQKPIEVTSLTDDYNNDLSEKSIDNKNNEHPSTTEVSMTTEEDKLKNIQVVASEKRVHREREQSTVRHTDLEKNITLSPPVTKPIAAPNNTTVSERLPVVTTPQVVANTETNNVIAVSRDQLSHLVSLDRLTTKINGARSLEINPSFIEPITPLRSQRWFVRARAGVLKNNTNVFDINPVEEFDNTIFDNEVDMHGLGLGLDIGRHLGEWRVFGGLDYTDAVTRYERHDLEVRNGQTAGTELIIIDDNGESHAVEGFVSSIIETTHDIQWHRHHRMLDLHMGVGRDLLRVGRFTIGLDAAIGYNININHNGYYFDSQDEPFRKFESGENNIYRKKMGFSAAIMGHLSFNLGRADISLIPVWRYQFTPFTNESNFYQIKNSQLGLQLGIIYKPDWE